MPTWSRLASATLLTALAIPQLATAKGVWQFPWIEVRSQHFVVRSALNEKKTRALVTELERFREMAGKLTNLRHFEERIPTEIVVLPRTESALGMRGGRIGFLLPGMRANYAVISPEGLSSDEVLKHEYVHFLVRNQPSAGVLPPWVDEGFAELLMTIRVTEDGTRLEYANAEPGRLEDLEFGNWLPYRTVLETRDPMELGRERAAMFYAQAWYLLHYLMVGRPDASFAPQLVEFLKLSEGGLQPVPAFEQAFDMKVGKLEAALRSYKGKYVRFQLKPPLPPVEAIVRPVAADVIAGQLAVICLEDGNVDGARKYDEAALALNANNARALVVEGDLLTIRKRWDEARPNYERAIALEPNDAHHELDFGEYFLHRAQVESDATKRAEWIVEARRHLFRSHKLDANDPETLTVNGLSYLVDPADPAKAIESLEAAFDMLPSQVGIQAALAHAYVAANRKEDARPILHRLIAWSETKQNPELEALLASLDEPASTHDEPEPNAAEPAPAQ